MENNIKQRAMDLQAAVVVNKPQLPEPVHEEADPRAGCTHHFSQSLLTDLGNYGLGRLWFAKMSSQARRLRISNIQIEVTGGRLRRQGM
jgi:hypothetical protein